MKDREILEKAQNALKNGDISTAQELLIETADGRPQTAETTAELLFRIGSEFRALQEPEKAADTFQTVLKNAELPPSLAADALLNLGQVRFELEQYHESAHCFRTLTELQPENASAWLTLGYILIQQNKNRDAINALKKAVELDAASPEACFYLAEALRKEERYEESLVYYQRMVPVAAEYPQAIHGYGKALLGAGNLEFGWDAMEFRKAYLFGSWERHQLPEWDANANQTVLVYSEEGIAADLMFASCLPDLLKNTEHAVVECDASLHSLFQRSFPAASFVPLSADTVGSTNPWGLALDSQTSFGSLPRFFRRSAEQFPLRKSYLVPDAEKVEKWSNRLAQIGGVPKIGFLWQGQGTAETERQTFLPLFELRNLMTKHPGEAAWVNLQGGSKQQELDAYRRNASLPIRQFNEVFQYDLDEMAALLVSLDWVITPPGHIAQLAAAVGAKTLLILPEHSDWRWNLGSDNVLWHPFLKLYRKSAKQSWSSLFKNLNDDLEEVLRTRRPPQEEAPATLMFPANRKHELLRKTA